MSVITALAASIAAFFTTDSNDDGLTGAAAVQAAITELGNIRNGTFEAELGEPDIERNDGEFFADPVVKVPVLNCPYGDAPSLVFDVPMGREDDNSDFWTFLDAVDVSFSGMAAIEGLTVPVQYVGGNLIILWDQLDADNESGSPERPFTAEDIEDVMADDEEDDADV